MSGIRRQSGLTLTELLVTMAIAAVLMAVAVPAAKRLSAALRDSAGARALINAALNNARAIAVRTGKDAGVRFQRAADGHTYMIFIVYDYERTGLANGFSAAEGRKPIALPPDIGVIDGYYIYRSGDLIMDTELDNARLSGDLGYGINMFFEDASTFSIVFSPSGRVTTRRVQVRRRNANDQVFNVLDGTDKPTAMFVQDDYPARGMAIENSRTRLIIYDKQTLSAIDPAARWSGYLKLLNPLVVSPYTGELIGE